MWSSNIAVVTMATLAALAAPAAARTYTATDAASLKAAWSAVVDGDTIKMVGTFGATELAHRSFAVPVTIDMKSATVTNAFVLRGDEGVNVWKGKFDLSGGASHLGKAIVVYGGSKITIDTPTVIGGGNQVGVYFSGSTDIAVKNGSFTGLWNSITMSGVTGATLLKNKIVGAWSDGMQIVDSHDVSATHNSCSGGNPQPGVHPDCIQLWSIKGNPPNSDISLSYNTATGPTQGFTSFNSKDGGGLRITMTHNRVDTSFSQGVACYGCVDSDISYNVLTTLPGSANRTTVNVVGGSNNTVEHNSIGPRLPASNEVQTFDARFDSFDASSLHGQPSDVLDLSQAVPEPGVWLMLIGGFGLVGMSMRRQSRTIAA